VQTRCIASIYLLVRLCADRHTALMLLVEYVIVRCAYAVLGVEHVRGAPLC
jgi:hypothetical protein